MVRNERFLPRIFDQINLALAADVIFGLKGLDPREFLSPNAKRNEVQRSMADFVTKIRTSGQLNKLISRESKDGIAIERSRIGLIAAIPERKGPYLGFYLDEYYTFILSLDKPDNSGCISFKILDENWKARDIIGNGSGEANTSVLRPGDLIITQLQGPTFSDSKGKVQVLPQLRWEVILVDLVVKWAKTTGFSRVYLLPGEFNKYYWTRNEKEREKLKLRYNVTAKRCGFKRDSKNEPFVLDFGYLDILKLLL